MMHIISVGSFEDLDQYEGFMMRRKIDGELVKCVRTKA